MRWDHRNHILILFRKGGEDGWGSLWPSLSRLPNRLHYSCPLFGCSPPKPVGQQLPHWLVPQVYVLKRPHVDEFLQRMGELFECVLFTASLAKVSPCLGSGSTVLSHPRSTCS